MALINRVARLFKADFHAVLDQIEEPEQLLKQAIRDMEDEVRSAERDLAALEQQQAQIRTRIVQVRTSVSDVDSELDLCFETGSDKLARGLIRKKLEAEKIVSSLQSKAEENEEIISTRNRQAAENTTALESLRQKAEAFAHRSRRSGTGDISWMSRELSVDDDEIEIAFLREKAHRSTS